jgi:hypothetical protein
LLFALRVNYPEWNKAIFEVRKLFTWNLAAKKSFVVNWMAEKGAILATVAELPRHKDLQPCTITINLSGTGIREE